MYPGSLFIDGIDFWNIWPHPFNYYGYYKRPELKWEWKTTDTKPACKCKCKPSIEESDNKFTLRLKGVKDSDYDLYFDGDRTFEVSFERTDGNATTKKSVKAYIPEQYDIAHEERMDGDDMVFEFPKKKEDKFENIKCEEHECQCKKRLKTMQNHTESIERTVDWMKKELDEAEEIGDQELVAYLEDSIGGLLELLKYRKEDMRKRKIIGKNKVWYLDDDNLLKEG